MEVEITQITCFSCNITFWVTSAHQQKLLKCKNTFYCPNGHSQLYKGESDAQKVTRLKTELRYKERCSESLARSNSALRGVITRNKNKKT